ncbi:MAG: zinc-dependent metalloprotease [Ignavibacteriales bacterium]|nr:zinc-dependent metalloprotease [Ignavibacteriales bacterium]
MSLVRIVLAILVLCSNLTAQQKNDPKNLTVAEKTAGFEKLPGFIPLYWDAKAGKVWLEIDQWDLEFLYVNSLSAGIGSNDIGLDRGQLGDTRVVKFQRSGPKVLLIEPNYSYRAVTENADERRTVEEAFAQSTIWGFDVVVEEGDRVLVDAGSFYLRDAHDVAGALKRSNQGTFRLDASRSAFHLPRTKNFPQNTEVEATLTFTGDDPGAWLRQVTPTPQAVTVRQHHSFIQLPDGNYTPRIFDPRAGYFGISYMDYATAIDEPITKRFIARHRLKKKDPAAAVSEPVKPIVYYLDRGTPEPVRSALLDGARWWSQAFEAAGYRDAFRVEMMPEGADPMDVRYNVIQWVHRSTRGWSYGATVTDPRTGEIIKGHVSLGSLRVRQDYLIAEGLLAPYEEGKQVPKALEEMALARLRQLSAHEVGHTIGLAHNYIASTENRASVMDYPHPWITSTKDGKIELSDAYASGIGEWDKVAVMYGYQDFPSGREEKKELESIILNAMKRGLVFLTDQDARPQGSSHPQTHLWDNGKDAVQELERLMVIRQIALKQFSEKNIKPGAPMATLEEALVPIYLLHRYQVEAAVKVLGGVSYTYAMRGDGQQPTTPVPSQDQNEALAALLATIKPQFLELPSRISDLIPPRPYGFGRHRELFRNRTGGTFDPLSAAEASAHHTVSLLLHPDRAARLVEQHARDQKQFGLGQTIDRLIKETWNMPRLPGLRLEIQHTVELVVLYNLMGLAANENAAPQVRALVHLKLAELEAWIRRTARAQTDESRKAHYTFALQQVALWKEDPRKLSLPRPAEAPPGQPIGDLGCDWE